MENNVIRVKKSPLEDVTSPTTFNRITSGILDFVFFLIVAILVMFVSSKVATRDGSRYHELSLLQNEHYDSCLLTKYDEKKGYIKYEVDDYYQKEDDNFFILNKLSYYYLNYLTGQNVKEGLSPSLDKDIKIKDENGNMVLPANLYTVSWFNEKVLGLTNTEASSSYFDYQRDGTTPLLDRIGTINSEFLDGSGNVISSERLNEEVNRIYSNAIQNFFSLKFMKDIDREVALINSILMLISTIPSLLIFYVIIPLCSPFGRTLGKMILKLAVISTSGYIAKKWQIALRPLLMLIVCLFVSFINSLQLSIITAVAVALISFSLMMFTKSKQCAHDFVSKTMVIKSDGVTIYRNEEEFEKAQAIIRERERLLKGNGK